MLPEPDETGSGQGVPLLDPVLEAAAAVHEEEEDLAAHGRSPSGECSHVCGNTGKLH